MNEGDEDEEIIHQYIDDSVTSSQAATSPYAPYARPHGINGEASSLKFIDEVSTKGLTQLELMKNIAAIHRNTELKASSVQSSRQVRQSDQGVASKNSSRILTSSFHGGHAPSNSNNLDHGYGSNGYSCRVGPKGEVRSSAPTIQTGLYPQSLQSVKRWTQAPPKSPKVPSIQGWFTSNGKVVGPRGMASHEIEAKGIWSLHREGPNQHVNANMRRSSTRCQGVKALKRGEDELFPHASSTEFDYDPTILEGDLEM